MITPMPIVLPSPDGTTTRKEIHSPKTSIDKLEADIKKYHQITTSIRGRTNIFLVKNAETHCPTHCSRLLRLVPVCLRWPRSKSIAEFRFPFTERELGSTEKKLLELQKNRRELEYILHLYEAALTPIMRIPPEFSFTHSHPTFLLLISVKLPLA